MGLYESEGISYAIQYSCKSMQQLQDYMNNYAAALQQDHINRYEGKFVAFRTLMERQQNFLP